MRLGHNYNWVGVQEGVAGTSGEGQTSLTPPVRDCQQARLFYTNGYPA